MCTKRVILDGSAPVIVTQRWSLVLRSDAIHPVVIVGKTAARPAQHRNLQRLQGFEHILAVAVDVGNLRTFTHPETTVDARSEVFGELSVDFAVNLCPGLVSMDCCLHVVTSHCRCSAGQCNKCRKNFLSHKIYTSCDLIIRLQM